jgi:hypothetical protein
VTDSALSLGHDGIDTQLVEAFIDDPTRRRREGAALVVEQFDLDGTAHGRK